MVALLDWSLITGTNDPSTIFTDPANGETADVSVTSSPGWSEFNANGFGMTGFNFSNGASTANPNTSTIDFGEQVADVSFELVDVDANPGSFADEITIEAVDINGNPVEVLFTDLEAYHQVTDNGDGTYTVLATGNTSTNFDPLGSPDSVSVSFAGPIASFTVVHTSGTEAGSGAVGISDVSFDILCFTAGTCIETPSGPRRVESLSIGDEVLTEDSGAQRVRWIGRKRVTKCRLGREPKLRPIKIGKDAFGHNIPERDVVLSPQHKVLVSGPQTQLLFGSSELLVPVKGLVNGSTVCMLSDVEQVEYVHIIFDKHEVVSTANLRSESYYPGEASMSAIEDAARDELLMLFPELAADFGHYGSTARKTLTVSEARLLS